MSPIEAMVSKRALGGESFLGWPNPVFREGRLATDETTMAVSRIDGTSVGTATDMHRMGNARSEWAVSQILARNPFNAARRDRRPQRWHRTEQILGTRLPADFKTLLDYYGDFNVDDFFCLMQPCSDSRNPYVRLADSAGTFSDFLSTREVLQQRGLTAYPAPGGLLMWGSTVHAAVLTWRTGDEPDEWPLVMLSRDQDVVVELPGTVAEFFLALLDGEFVPGILPADWLIPPPSVWGKPRTE